MVVKTISPQIEILKFNDYKAKPYTVTNDGVTENAEGRKVVKAGTPFPANDETAQGILLYDVDVTDGPQAAAIAFEGSFDGAKIATNGITLSAACKAALPRVTIH